MSALKRKIKRWLGLKISALARNVEAEFQQSSMPDFRGAPDNLLIEPPYRLINTEKVFMGNDVSLGPGCMINAILRYPGRFLSGVPDDIEISQYDPEIRIGNRVSATGYLTISAVENVTIEDDVLIASHVFISDHSHGRSRADIAYKYQSLEQFGKVIIGQGSWLGEHVIVMPGVTIGRNSIIGANSVVTRDVPDKCVAVGAPARVVKTWSEEFNRWENAA